MSEKVVLIANCRCNRNCFSKVFEVVELCEDCTCSLDELVDRIRELTEDSELNFRVKRWTQGPVDKFEKPLIVGDDHSIVLKDIIDPRERQNILYAAIKNSLLNYHIRVRFDQSEDIYQQVADLSYLFQFMQSIDPTIISNRRLSVFLVPRTGNRFPFSDALGNTDYELYDICSEYLRLIAKQYTGVIFGVTNDSKTDDTTVSAVDYQKKVNDYGLFPLIFLKSVNEYVEYDYDDKSRENRSYLEKHYTSIDNYELLFNNYLKKESLSRSFKSDNAVPFNFANHRNAYVGLADCLINLSVQRIKTKISGINSVANYDIYADKLAGLNRFVFALFSYLYSVEDNYSPDKLGDSLERWIELSKDLGSAIQQIVQNSLQHSSAKLCCISVFWDKSNNLKIHIVDVNDENTIIENFYENLKNEINFCSPRMDLSGYNPLLSKKSSIKLRNFFGDFEETDPINEWFLFRQTDSSAHVGLAIFAQTAKRCKAQVELISTKQVFAESKNIYIRDFQDDNPMEGKQSDIGRIRTIPGMDMMISIPHIVMPFLLDDDSRVVNQRNVSQLWGFSGINENYEAYAKFLTFKYELLSASAINGFQFRNHSKLLSYTEKLEEQIKLRDAWQVFLSNLTESSCLYCIDMNGIDIDLDYSEIVIKGLISYLSETEEKSAKKYVAFINVCDNLLDTIKRLFPLYPWKSFSSSIQLCFMGERSETLSVKQYILAGNNVADVTKNAYLLSIERGNSSFDSFDCVLSEQLLEPFSCFIDHKNETSDILPFELLIKDEKTNLNIFFADIVRLANYSIDEECEVKGYKFKNTHIMLGNKIHIKSFYEMSFLFYRTFVANSVAFYILNKMIFENVVDFNNDSILFYGYASYSQAIVVSLSEMLKAYLKNENARVYYSTYQYNLQSEMMSEDIKIYLSENAIKQQKDLKVIQIVPISSTVTTFENIFAEFKKEQINDDAKFVKNYTVFLVREGNDDKVVGIEKDYWDEIKNNIITAKENAFQVEYIMSSQAKWYLPTQCELCFPKCVYDEVPIIHTDHTSTVPSQQIGNYQRTSHFVHDNTRFTNNNDNIMDLKDCVLFGHIARGSNHYSYYIDTQKYFSKVSSKVKQWLINIRENDKKSYSVINSRLNIIFSPEHNTNVGFSQYVNAFYFGGLAEVVSVKVDKEFRSNFICEHDALYKTIARLFKDLELKGQRITKDTKQIYFYFVDDNIISGGAFRKSENLLYSIIPRRYRNLYESGIFEKCFVLVDRLSASTKFNYVNNPESNFLSFCHVDVSNMRHQGDSCVGCKTHNDMSRLYERSSTKHLANYWYNKASKQEITNFGKALNEQSENIEYGEAAFKRMVMSHIIRNILQLYRVQSDIGRYYDFLISMTKCVLEGDFSDFDENPDYDSILILLRKVFFDAKSKESLYISTYYTFIDVISNPFFTYNFKLKTCLIRFLILLSETLFSSQDLELNCSAENRSFWNTNDRFAKTKGISNRIQKELWKDNRFEIVIMFYQKVILLPLINNDSNYFLLESTIKNICRYFDDCYTIIKSTNKDLNTLLKSYNQFWREYSANTYKLIECCLDDSKSIKLEKTLHSCLKYRDECVPLYTEIRNIIRNKELLGGIKSFCYELFLQNNRIIYQTMTDSRNRSKEQGGNPARENTGRYRDLFYSISYPMGKKLSIGSADGAKAYYSLLKENIRYGGPDKSIEGKYNDLCKSISKMIADCFSIFLDYSVLTSSGFESEKINKNKLAILNTIENNHTSEMKYDIKERVILACNQKDSFDLLSDGYYLGGINCNNEVNPFFVLHFGGEQSSLPKEKNMIDVFFYFKVVGSSGASRSHIKKALWLSIRHILSCRNILIEMLSADFNNSVINNYSYSIGTEAILAHEKAASHSPIESDRQMLDLLPYDDSAVVKAYPGITDNNKDKISNVFKWLLLRNYVNSHTAKLFNRVVSRLDHNHIDYHDEGNNSLPLFVDEPKGDKRDTVNHPFKTLSELLINPEVPNEKDYRFTMLKQVVDFKCEIEDLDRKIIVGENGEYYNLEIIKCIFLSIMLDAIKYKSLDVSRFLNRINDFMVIKSRLNKILKRRYSNERFTKKYIERLNQRTCIINVNIEKTTDEFYDWLVIKNEININTARIYGDDYSKKLKRIIHKLEDPLDFADGHMSLLTIKNYIELLPGCKFNSLYEHMFSYEWDPQKRKMYFITRLPILAKEDN